MSADAPAAARADRPAAGPGALRRRRLAVLAAALVVLVLAVVLLVGSSQAGPDTGAAALVPADALAYVNVSLDTSRPSVRRALQIAQSFPGFPLGAAAVEQRLSAILGGGRGAEYSTQIRPWLGDEAALALLNTASSTAGSLLLVNLRNPGRARAFVHAQGAIAHGSYRGTQLLAYPTGSEIAFISHYLVLGQDASVRAALDVQAGASQSLADSPVYRRAAADEPPDRVLDAYASLAGVRRILAPRGGLIGALGALLYQPALQGVTLSIAPSAGGARLSLRSALDPSLVKLDPPVTQRFSPTLQRVMPAGSIAMFDVVGLNRIAGRVLSAGAVAGIAGGIGPLLSRLGAALSSEGVDVHAITAIFGAESAVAIVPRGSSPTLVIVARTQHEQAVRTELAELEVPLAQLFTPRSGSGRVPVFNDRSVAGITARQVVLAPGLELDYAVFRGLVVVSTSLQGVASVAADRRALARDPGYQAVLGHRPDRVTALVYLDLPRLLTLGVQTGLAKGARFRLLRPDLDRITAVGLTSTRGPGESDSELNLRIP